MEHCPEPAKLHQKNAISRRRFLFLGTAAAAAVVAAPYVQLASPALVDGLGFSRVVIPTRQLYGRIVISGPVIRDSVNQRGAFWRAALAERDAILAQTARQEERLLLGMGRRPLSDRRLTGRVSEADGTAWIAGGQPLPEQTRGQC